MDVGNALRFVVRSAEGSGVGNRIALSITSIDGTPVSETLVTAGDNTASQAARVYAGASLRDGYAVQGTVTFTFTGSYPPIGSALDLTITAGNVTCEGAAGAAQLYYVSTDHLGTPRAITNQSQQLVWRWENQEAFGDSQPEENPAGQGTFSFPLRFPGQYADKETNTNFNYFRDYDPQTGRYVQSDPIGLAGGPDTYAYVRNQPNIFIDPLGLVRCYLKHRSSAPFDLITRDTVSTSLGPIPMYDSSETVKCALELDLFKRSPIFGGPLSAAFCLLSGAKYADSAVRLALVTATVYSTSYSQWFTEEWCLDECSGEEKFRSVVASGVTRLSRPEVVSTHCRLGLEPVLRGAPNSFWSTGK